MRGGALATLQASDDTVTRNELTLNGDRGSVRIDSTAPTGSSWSGSADLPGAPRTRLRRALANARQAVSNAGEIRRGGAFDASYDAEWRAFARCVRGEAAAGVHARGRPPRAPGGAGRCTFDHGRPVRSRGRCSLDAGPLRRDRGGAVSASPELSVLLPTDSFETVEKILCLPSRAASRRPAGDRVRGAAERRARGRRRARARLRRASA